MPDQLTRIAVLQNLETVLKEFGLNAETELAKLDMNMDMFRDGDLLVDVNTVAAVLDHCSAATAAPDFSLRLAAAQDMSFLGVLALFLQTSSTLGEALQEISQYNHVHHAQAVSWRLEVMGNAVIFNLYLDVKKVTAKQHRLAVDLAMGHAYRVIEALTQNRVRFQRVMLRCDRPAEMHAYRRFFQAPIEFNAEADGLVFPAADLGMALVRPDPQMHESLRGQISSIEQGNEQSSMLHEIRSIIRALLPTGDSSLERVAQCYTCDKRTLQRYLREKADTSFQCLLDEVRFNLVQQYLRNSYMPITRIAYVAGFSDPSNFARAFRRHLGMSPREWRKQNQERTPSRRKSVLN